MGRNLLSIIANLNKGHSESASTMATQIGCGCIRM